MDEPSKQYTDSEAFAEEIGEVFRRVDENPGTWHTYDPEPEMRPVGTAWMTPKEKAVFGRRPANLLQAVFWCVTALATGAAMVYLMSRGLP